MAMDIVLGKIADYLVVPIGRQIGYLFCYNSNIRNLRDQVTHLEKMRVGIQLSVDIAKRNIEDIGPEVEHWLKEVSKVKDDSDEILERTDEFENGWCPNLISRYSLSKKATKKTQNIGDLKQVGDKYTKLSYPAPPVQTLSISTEIFKCFKSRMETTKELMVALKDDDSNIIGISGMGGVGKTTMVEEVVKMAKNEKLFDEVVMATVSKKQELFKIQSHLAGMLGLSLVEETNPLETAGKLRERLSNVQRSLVILDDLWEEMDLGKLGIPLGRNGGGHKGCKVVLTSRDEHVCNVMGSQKNFIVQVLSQVEARDLFKEVAGITNDFTGLQKIAEKVADECGGLPLAIVTLAKSLKNRSKHSWNHRLRQLRECNGIPEKVKLSIKLSYDVLTGEAKSLLLLCSLFPEDYDIPIECLVRYGFGLRLFKPIVTVAEARDWVYSLIDELRSCYLILAGDEENVKLHDVVRDVCVSIASQPEHAYLVRCDVGLEEWPQEGAYEHYTTISLMFNKIKELPTGLDCPNLKLLHLECRDQARSEDSELCPSRDFFEGMKEVRVFVLRYMFLQLPPSPLNSLMKIRTLCLDFCQFRTNNISAIGSLKSLEILSFFKSEIVQLPIEIGQLGHLKVLDLRCALDVKILPGILSKLVKLEELYMVNYFAEWFVAQGFASITELNLLSNLTTFKIVMSPANLSKLMGFCFANLRRFDVEIKSEKFYRNSNWKHYGFKNRLALYDCDILKLSEIGIKVLLGQCETVELREVRGMGTNLFCQLDEKDFLRSQKLVVRNCEGLEYLTCSNLRAETFGQLQELELHDLSAMKCLFPLSVVKCLVQLRKLEVWFCSSMEYVVKGGEDEKDGGRILFPKLNFLSVSYLPRLRSVYPNPYILTKNGLFHEEVQVLMPSIETLHVRDVNLVEYIVDCHMEAGQANSFQSLQDLQVINCEGLTAVFDFEGPEVRGEHVQVTLGQLKSLYVQGSPRLMHIWRMAPKELKGFQNLQSLRIIICKSMIYVLPLTVAKLLIILRELTIANCEMLEEIIEPEQDCSEIKDVEEIVTKKGGEKMVMEKIVFPQLSNLSLRSLTNLTGFCSSKFELEFPSLTRLWIASCGKMKTFCSGPVCAPKIPNLDHVDCSDVIRIG